MIRAYFEGLYRLIISSSTLWKYQTSASLIVPPFEATSSNALHGVSRLTARCVASLASLRLACIPPSKSLQTLVTPPRIRRLFSLDELHHIFRGLILTYWTTPSKSRRRKMERRMNTVLASCIAVCALVNPVKGFMVANGPLVTVGRARSVKQKKRFVEKGCNKLGDP